MWLRRISAVAVALVVSLAYSEPARSSDNTVWAGAIATALVGALVCPSVALGVQHPDDTSEYERKGWFANLAGTYAVEMFEEELEDELRDVRQGRVHAKVDDSLGVNGGAGYRCHRFLSTEVEVEWIDGFETDISDPSGFAEGGSIDPDALTVTTNFRGYLPLGRFQPYALAGAGIMFARVPAPERYDPVQPGDPPTFDLTKTESVTSFAVRFGGGLDFYATEHIVLNIGVEQVMSIREGVELDYLSVGWGIQYRFCVRWL